MALQVATCETKQRSPNLHQMGRHLSLDLVDHGTQLDFPAVYLSGKPLLFRSLLPSQERVPRGGLASQPIQGLNGTIPRKKHFIAARLVDLPSFP